jgi:arylsulfatase A-like enzyme
MNRRNAEDLYGLIYATRYALLVLLAQAALLMWAHFGFETPGDRTTVIGVKSIVVKSIVIVAALQIVNQGFTTTPLVRRFANFAIVATFLVLFAIHACTEHSPDFYALGDNFNEILYVETWRMVVSTVPWAIGLITANALLLLGIVSLLPARFNEWPRSRHPMASIAVPGVLLTIITFTGLHVESDFTYFARSGVDYFCKSHAQDGPGVEAEYPYVKRVGNSDIEGHYSDDNEQPHIFLVLMESFNANFVGMKTSDDVEITPTFNEMIKSGVYCGRFYGNSIQSARGREAILCSILPSIRGKVSTDFPQLSLRSLPSILSQNGYRTMYFDGFRSLDFDNMNEFMVNIGFDECQAMNEDFLTDDDEQFVWGWGLQDDRLFKKVFETLDASRKSSSHSRDNAPVFVTISTVSNHYSFDYRPPNKQSPFPVPADRREVYANSLHLADSYLREFFEQLASRKRFKNSLIIITGDHSFPAGEHGNYYNERGFNEEVFRTPCLLLWQGKLQPQRISTPHSQLDIAPTILDLLRIRADNHFRGASIFQGAEKHRAIHLIQPYDGTHLCVIKGSMKYVLSVRVPGEYLFDLSNDPNEERNILDEYRDRPLLNEMRHEIANIWLNQTLIERDRVWPRSTTKVR